MIRRLCGLSCAAVLLFVAAACGSSDDTAAVAESAETGRGSMAGGEPLVVVVTTNILADVVANILGEDGEVTVLLPVGVDPHDYRPSSSDVTLLHKADLVVASGLRLEEGLVDVLATAVEDGINLIEVAEALDPIEFTAPAHHGDDEEEGDEEEDHGNLDPHFWMDPLRVAKAARLVAEQLVALAPSIEWTARADAYASLLEELDAEIQDILAPIPEENRKLLTNHDSLGYFANRYGFEIIGVVIPSGATLADPSSAGLAGLVEEIEEEGVQAIFAETVEPSSLAHAVAAEVGPGVEVVEIYSGSLGEPGSGADSLIGMLRTNAQRIVEALA